MGNSNKNRKLFAGVLGVAVVGLILDKTVFSEHAPGPKPDAHADSAAAQPALSPTQALVQKLHDLEQSHDLPGQPGNAFWFAGEEPPRPAKAATKETEPPAGPAEEFARSHRLKLVMKWEGDRGARALIEYLGKDAGDAAATLRTRTLAIGESIDGWTLIDISPKNAAKFTSGNLAVELAVPLSTDRKPLAPPSDPDSR